MGIVLEYRILNAVISEVFLKNFFPACLVYGINALSRLLRMFTLVFTAIEVFLSDESC